jgi:FkbM family methyltransferase
MNKPGPFLRRNFPKIYFFLVYIINGLKRIATPYSIYITDSLGGSFKNYVSGSEMTRKISDLKRNLDKGSCETIDVIMKRIAFYPDETNKHRISGRKEIAGGLLQEESEQTKQSIAVALNESKRKYKFPLKSMEDSVFYYYHGLRLLPDKVTDYIRYQDFLDIGAFVGDSAIALYEYNYRKIFSIEMSHKSIEKYKANMAKCNISENKYEIINACIVSDDDRKPVRLADTGSPGFSLLRNRGKYDEIEIDQKSVDFIVEKYKISPRFIKVDIEGNALEFVRGATKTMTCFRPVFSIAIYHNPYEFFEVKPFLESLLNNYVYIIRKLSSGLRDNLCHSDVFLIGYPGEIISRTKN